MRKLQFLPVVITLLLIILTIDYGSCSRSIKENSSLLSDGLDDNDQTSSKSSVLELYPLTTMVTCEPIYGFLPCTTRLLGQFFMLVVYQYLLYLSDKSITSGSKLFFDTFGRGFIGDRLFHLLVMFPKLIFILVTGISANKASIENMASVSMALLAGSTIMMLTITWGSIIAWGSYELSDTSSSSTSSDAKKNKTCSLLTDFSHKLFGYGVTCVRTGDDDDSTKANDDDDSTKANDNDDSSKANVQILFLSMVPFLVLQLAAILSSATAKRIVVLISLIISLVLLVFIFIYKAVDFQLVQEWRIENFTRRYIQKNLMHKLLSPEGEPDKEEIIKLFATIDLDNDKAITLAELKAFLISLQIDVFGLDEEDFATKIMQEFDLLHNRVISQSEFVTKAPDWLKKAHNDLKGEGEAHGENRLFAILEKIKNNKDRPWWNYIKSAFFITLGIVMALMLTNPLMITLIEFSSSTNIPSFVVSYILIPFALNLRQLYRLVTSANKLKEQKATYLSFSELYGAVYMNNVMGLAIFLLLVFVRDISWVVSAQVLVVLLICIGMGCLAYFNTKIRRWIFIPLYLLYPISLLLIYVLTDVRG